MSNTTASSPMPHKVLIVDDHPIVRQGLEMMIDAQSDLTVCGVAEDVPGALELIESCSPDVLVVDISLKGGDGLELIKRARAEDPKLLALVLSSHAESLYADRALRAGARGYLTKQQATTKVLDALRQILAGELYASAEHKARLRVERTAEPGTFVDPVSTLSDRELQVFRMIGQGRATRHIAEELFLSVKTVESHRRNIKQKLGLTSANELVQHAVRLREP